MQEYWYHSPVRFFRHQNEHENPLNPQNASYFGGNRAYPLEVGVWHRFLLPMYDNEFEEGDYSVYLVNDNIREKIDTYIYIKERQIKHISFKSDIQDEGCLVVVDSSGKDVLFSNRIRFLDSSDFYGRKYIRIATKNNYNKGGFDFEEKGAWFITNLPAYCLGMTGVDVEVSNNRTGGNSSLMVKDSFSDDITKYQFESNGDANVLNFIQFHSINDDFFIDGVKKTALEKIEKDDFSMSATLEFASVKNEDGLNIILHEEEILMDTLFSVEEYTPVHRSFKRLPETYDKVAVRFNQNFTLTKDLNKKVHFYRDGKLFFSKNANEVRKQGFSLIILEGQSLDKGGYEIIIEAGFLEVPAANSNENETNIGWVFYVYPETHLSLNIELIGEKREGSGGLNSIIVSHNHTYNAPNAYEDFIRELYWEVDYGNGYFTYEKAGRRTEVKLQWGNNNVRLRGVSNEGRIIYSNILQYTKDS